MKIWRIWLIAGIIFLSYTTLIFNVYNLQITKGGYYSARAHSQSRSRDLLAASRGKIYFTDKNGNRIPAAINREFPVIFAVPKEIADAAEAAEALGPVLNLGTNHLKDLFSKPDDLYERLVEKASEEQVAAIKSLGIKGIYIDSENFRFYPFGSLASQLLGFVGPDDQGDVPEGRYGLEFFYEDALKKGKDVHLTVDVNIQSQADKLLDGLVGEHRAAGGTVIVEDPKTGKILAMANQPGFDPNDYGKFPLKSFLNPAVQSVYEPGSIFKVLTMSAGIDSEKITPQTTFYDTGSLTLNGKTIKNWDLKAHGTVSMTQVIEKSINTGAAFAEKKTGHDNFYNYLLKFGFNQPTSAGLPGEITGTLRNLKSTFREINFANASFGQGVSVTPLQLAAAISAIANNGALMKPYLSAEENPETIRGVISAESARQVIKMMVSAVNKAEIARISGYEVAGKTGTAQIPDFKHGGYSSEYIHSYGGFAPASDPRFVILIKLDKPQGASLAGLTVVPAFRELAQFILNYYNIPADNL